MRDFTTVLMGLKMLSKIDDGKEAVINAFTKALINDLLDRCAAKDAKGKLVKIGEVIGALYLGAVLLTSDEQSYYAIMKAIKVAEKVERYYMEEESDENGMPEKQWKIGYTKEKLYFSKGKFLERTKRIPASVPHGI